MIRTLLTGLALALAVPAAAQDAPAAAPDYARPEAWLCLPRPKRVAGVAS